MKRKVCNVLLISVVCMISCSTDDIETSGIEKVESKSAGDFIVVNKRTNETLTIKEATEDGAEEIIAHVGDTLKITFNPETKYKDYSFKKRYILPDNRVEGGKENDSEYEYVITSLKKGVYGIDLEASSSGTNDKTNWDLQAKGKFNMKIVPYVNVDYVLSCPNALLEFATPQVIYVGNDGKPVTFTIPESDWKELIYPESWDLEDEKAIVVIDGESIISEQTKTMQWTKYVEYDDFSVIDDEMTVVYIPKNNIPTGNVDKIEGLKPRLNANLEFADDDGQKRKPMIIDIDVDMNIGAPGSKSLYEIISNHRNYKGFHVESNGTYDTKKEDK
ncbi:MAG: hypothetical protein J1E57_05220 [Prevotella sp.]|nr:hypothetical protein [Prevotella sp.]